MSVSTEYVLTTKEKPVNSHFSKVTYQGRPKEHSKNISKVLWQLHDELDVFQTNQDQATNVSGCIVYESIIGYMLCQQRHIYYSSRILVLVTMY